jgi:hypothetical protein
MMTDGKWGRIAVANVGAPLVGAFDQGLDGLNLLLLVDGRMADLARANVGTGRLNIVTNNDYGPIHCDYRQSPTKMKGAQ